VETLAASAGDAGALATVHRAAAIARYADIFPLVVPPPSLCDLTREWAELIASAPIALVASDEGAVVGGVAVGADPDVPAGWALRRLYVHPDRWGSGVGARLHDEALGAARRLGIGSLNLWVLERNRIARTFYERRGWRLVPGEVLHNDPPDIVDVLYVYDPGRS
jgi:GNAT superfamily N-acetyltransferase